MIKIIRKSPADSKQMLLDELYRVLKAQGIRLELNDMLIDDVEIDAALFSVGNNNYFENYSVVNGPLVFSEKSNRSSNCFGKQVSS